jgi:tRNA (guanine37-N1)-methyltransferase
MHIDVVTGFPLLVAGPLKESILHRAQEKGVVKIVVHDLRDYTTDKHRTIDDTPFGGGAGMILKPEPVFACIEALRAVRTYDEVIYLSADGEPYGQGMANALSLKKNLLLLCGHYKGIDERIRETFITREISVGDYVLTGGELPALVVIDSIVRLIPGVMSDGESLLEDSFQDGLLDTPQYTRPAEFRGMKVPEVLLSGNHAEIRRWRTEQRQKRTQERRKDLLEHS